MKKKEIKGLSAFELLEGLDDDMILSASLPEEAPIPVPTKGERVAAFFTRMGKGGVAAAVASAAVIVGVLVGVVLSGRVGPFQPSDTDQSHGIQGNPPLESGMVGDTNDGNNGVFIPPLNQPSPQEKGPVSVVSDGITVYPKGYCVYISEMRRDENGELIGLDGDGFGAVYQLGDIWDSLPTLQTAGNDFDVILPDHMTLRSVRVFEMVEVQTKTFEELALISDEMEDYRDRPWEFLSTLRGEYTVVLEVYHETNYSEDEYTKGVDEYAFKLDVDPTMNENAPVRVIHGDKPYFPTGYPLEESYYDAELQKEVVKHYIGAESTLKELAKTLPTVTMTQGESLSLYLAPFYDLKSVKVYRDLTLWAESETEEPLTQLSEWDTGDYYFIITAAHIGTGETFVNEYPFHVKLVEKTEEDETEEDNGIEIPSMPEEYHLILEDLVLDNGCMLWAEAWYNGMMESADGLGAKGQLAELVAGGALDDYRLRFPVDTPFLYKHKLTGVEAPLDGVAVYDRNLNLVGKAPNFTVIHTPPLPAGEYIVVLTVKYQGDYIPEADAYEGICYEYPFILELYDPE